MLQFDSAPLALSFSLSGLGAWSACWLFLFWQGVPRYFINKPKSAQKATVARKPNACNTGKTVKCLPVSSSYVVISDKTQFECHHTTAPCSRAVLPLPAPNTMLARRNKIAMVVVYPKSYRKMKRIFRG